MYKYVRKRKLVCDLIISLIISIISVTLINMFSLENKRDVTINITALNEKNETALATNVRIKAIYLNNKKINLSSLERSDAWEIREEGSIQALNLNSPASLSVPLKNVSNIKIEFIKEVGSGLANVNIENRDFKLDLYSEGWENYTLEYNLPFKVNAQVCGIFLSTLSITFLTIVLLRKYVDYYKIKKDKLKKRNKLIFCFGGALSFTLAFTLIMVILCPIIIWNTGKDITINFTATSEKGEKALANNVRINKITVNNADLDLDKLNFADNWKHYDGCIGSYDNNGESTLSLELKNVIFLDVGFVKELGSGIVEIKTSDGTYKKLDLYSDSGWKNYDWNYMSQPILQPYKYPVILISIFIASFIILYFLLSFSNERIFKAIKKIIIYTVLSFLLALIINLCVAIIQEQSVMKSFSWIYNNIEGFIGGYMLIVLLIITLMFLSGYPWVAFSFVGFFPIVLSIINYYKLEFRGTPIYPWDFMLISVAESIVSSFDLKISFSIIISLIIYILCIIILYFFRLKESLLYVRRRLVGYLCFGLMLIITIIYLRTSFINFNDSIDVYKTDVYYKEKGFITAFTKSCRYLLPVSKPKNYSKEVMNDIVSEVNMYDESEYTTEKPNIIMIMSESFWDISRLKNVQFKEALIPNFNKLKEESVSGQMLASVFGGGTVNTEFEALTGFSMNYLPPETMPYQKNITENFFSIANYLKSEDYSTLAIHPYLPSNYNRANAYPLMGFDKFISEKDFDKSSERMRTYISDMEVSRRIIQEFENEKKISGKPWFNFTVTMQNHGGYFINTFDEKNRLPFKTTGISETVSNNMNDYIAGLHASDTALAYLVNYFRDVKEPTIIIFFGDHMSNVGVGSDNMLEESGYKLNNGSLQDIYNLHLTPVLVWSNYEKNKKDLGTISAYEILPKVMENYKLKKPLYFNFLDKLSNIAQANSSGVLVENNGHVKSSGDMSEEEKQMFDKFELIQYDYIYGKRYSRDIFNIN
ncbi:LTA synthase family protein [Clostridium beijerinckii]|uniref:LTA synthase family protein n=1 Tax=Clostridium beijerinckii TaxID=1520 RepID=UPI001F373FCD|nr:LTA synthase family protein [Clostridium beijerinckii]